MAVTRNQTRFIVGAIIVLVGLYVLATLVRWAVMVAVVAVIAIGALWWLRRAFGGSGRSDLPPDP